MDVRKHLTAPPMRTVRWGMTDTNLLKALAAMRLLIWWLLPASALVAVAAQPVPESSRGELLYATHCIGCHTAQVHWRDKRLATDWPSLRKQVSRWQANTGLGWSDDDIVAVTRYLNDLYYRFPAPDSPLALERPPRA